MFPPFIPQQFLMGSFPPAKSAHPRASSLKACIVVCSEKDSFSLQRIHESHQGEAVNFIRIEKNSIMVCVGVRSPNND